MLIQGIDVVMIDRLASCLADLMLIPGLSGHEDRVRRHIAGQLATLEIGSRTDTLGNLIATLDGSDGTPSMMLFAHMDQLGFVVRRIEPDGFIRLERLGGVPEKALPSLPVLFCIGEGRDRVGVIANKSHHATAVEDKYRVVPYAELYVDVGAASAAEVRAMGIAIGTPVIYEPRVMRLGDRRMAGPAIDDRAGCAVLLAVAAELRASPIRPTVHLVFSVQEEFNLRGASVAAQGLSPDIAIQLDLALTGDTPDMANRSEVALGEGPAMSLYSFHGRGTLNGTIPHPALVSLFERAARTAGIPLQRTAQVGVLTDSAYVQLVGRGVAAIDLCFPCRYTHSALEVCDLGDLQSLANLLLAGLRLIDLDFTLDRDRYT